MGKILHADDWELRCRFNRGEYLKRLTAGEFESKINDTDPLDENNQPSGTISRTVTYFEKGTENEIAVTHQYILPPEKVSKRRFGQPWPDPKKLVDGDTLFIQKPGSKFIRDPGNLLGGSRWRKEYNKFRRWCCDRYGPGFVRLVAHLHTPIVYPLDRCITVWQKFIEMPLIARLWTTR